MQGKGGRERNVTYLSSYLVEKTDKVEKPSVSTEVRSDNLNGESEKKTEKEEVAPYEKKYYGLLHRCEIIKQSNERLVNRIYHVKKLLRRRKKERKFLMDRLDGYGDDYRSVALSLFAEMIGDSPPEGSKKSDNFLTASHSQESES
ncbi:TCF3 fusion partner homolog [Stegodyphus dumicola]|uniref:TCF3 fusion partner homolog n=1 Tax=Stegodyphus dumicola TaxID=202533 RepID=UPI0015B340FD|nr:TCF3 fusion partner homolog [Stegodyphus dumicola]XP_035224883.1 TCF3 fusion partner homolog [Stegodyphus dumicola]